MKKIKKIKILIILLIIILIPLYILNLIDNFYSEQTTKYISTEVTNILSNHISKIITEQLKYQNLDLVEYIYDNNNNVSNISLNSYNINKLLAISNDKLSELIYSNEIQNKLLDVEFPLGQMLGLTLLAKLGPKIYIDTLLINDYKIDLLTDLVEYGINNTMFSAFLLININVTLLIPLRETKVNFQTKLYLINEILQGQIPNIYFKG